jgi:hypothetical protein
MCEFAELRESLLRLELSAEPRPAKPTKRTCVAVLAQAWPPVARMLDEAGKLPREIFALEVDDFARRVQLPRETAVKLLREISIAAARDAAVAFPQLRTLDMRATRVVLAAGIIEPEQFAQIDLDRILPASGCGEKTRRALETLQSSLSSGNENSDEISGTAVATVLFSSRRRRATASREP